VTATERRRASRRAMWFPAEVGRGERFENVAVGINASLDGVLIACRRAYDVGERLCLRIVLPGDGSVHLANGRVVRHIHDRTAHLWRHHLAIELDQGIPALAA